MVTATQLLGFGIVAFGMACSPGPNMLYLASRSVTQGRWAGVVSLLGVATGFVFWVFMSALGITALLVAVPYGYQGLKLAGAGYLLWLAWQTVRPGAEPAFATRPLSPDRPLRLYGMGLVTNLLNPKAAVLYLSLLPQFVAPARGHVFGQSLLLGCVQIAVSLSVNLVVIWGAGGLARWLGTRPSWLRVQRWLLASVLGALAVRLAAERRPT
jgi:threonine/homoserine/homoserine lactone efflux protein